MKKLVIRLLLSLLIGAAMLYAAFRQLHDPTWNRDTFLDVLAFVRWELFVPYIGIMALQHLLRAWRWGYLLAPFDKVPLRRLLPIASVGFFAILALPLRMGEFVRPYLIANPPHLRMSHSLGTLAVERVFDGLLLSLLAFSAVFIAERRTEVQIPLWILFSGIVALVLFAIALVVLIMIFSQRARAVSLCRALVGLVSKRLADRAASIAEGIVEGFAVLPDWRRLVPYLVLTLGYWYGNVLAIWVLAHAFHLPFDHFAALGFVAFVGIGIMIPAGPGFVGNYEVFALGAISFLLSGVTVDEHSTLAFVITSHLANALWYCFAGALALLSPHVTLRKFWQASSE